MVSEVGLPKTVRERRYLDTPLERAIIVLFLEGEEMMQRSALGCRKWSRKRSCDHEWIKFFILNNVFRVIGEDSLTLRIFRQL